MKKGNRALAVLLSLVITLSYMPAMAFAGTEEGADQSGNGNVESGLEVENEDQTLTTGGDTVNDVEESNVQEEQAESNTPTANQQEPEEEPVLLGAEGDDTEPVEEYVASIGDAKYTTVADALGAAKAGETIKLLGDIDLSKESITSGGYAAIGENCDIVLDLNGHAVTGAALDLYGKMVVDDSSSEKNGSITGVKHAIWVNPNASLEVKGGTVSSGTGCAIRSDNASVIVDGGAVKNSTGNYAIFAENGTLDIKSGSVVSTADNTPGVQIEGACEAKVEGGTITGHDWGIAVFNTSCLTVSGNAVIGTSEDEGYGITTNGNAGQNATIVINGGKITGAELGIYQPSGTVTVSGGSISGATGIYQKSGKLTITGGTITGNGEKSEYDYNGNGAHPTGDAIVVDNCGYPGGVPAPVVSGGTIESTNATPVGSYAYNAEGQEANEPVVGFVTGGTFSSEIAQDVCGEGFVCEKNEDGTYGVVTLKPIAKFGTWSVPNAFYLADADPVPEATVQAVAPTTITREGSQEAEPITSDMTLTWTVTSSSATDPSEPDDNIATVDDKGQVTFKKPGSVKVWLTITEANGSSKSLYKSASYSPRYIAVTIGSEKTGYTTLNAALKAAANNKGAVISILGDITLQGFSNRVTFTDAHDVTLDLGGHTVTVNGANFTLNGGKLTVTNGTLNVKGNMSQQFTVNSGELNITDSATINTTGTVSVIGLFGPATVNTAGNLTSQKSFVIAGNGSSGKGGYTVNVTGGQVTSAEVSAIYHPNEGTVNISGGSVTGATGIYQKAGTLNITGGTITGNGEKTDYTHNGNGANATGDAIVIDNCGYPGGVPAPVISGGTINSTNAAPIGSYAYTAEGQETNEPVGGFVTGGTFSSEIAQDVCGEGFVCEKNEDGTYGVVTLKPIKYFNSWSVPYVYYTDKDNIPVATTQCPTPTIKREGESKYHAAEDFVKISWKVTDAGATSADGEATSIATVDDNGLITFKEPGKVRVWLTMTDAAGTKSAYKTASYSFAPVYIERDGTKVAYGSLYAAFNAAKSGEKIVLLDNNVLTNIGKVTLSDGRDITVDLNGNSIQMNVKYAATAFGAIFTVNKGSLTIVDSVGGGKIEASGTNCRAFNLDGKKNSSANDAKLVISEGVSVSSADDCCVTVFGKATLETSGDLSSPADFAIAGNGSAGEGGYVIEVKGGSVTGDEVAIYHPNEGILTVSGGSITGDTGIYQKAGTLNITGGTITGNGEKKDYTYNGNGANATGDAVVIDNCGYPGSVPAPAITGGTFNSTNAAPIASYVGNNIPESDKVAGFVSDGTFSGEVPEELCAEGLRTRENEDGTYGVVEIVQDEKEKAIKEIDAVDFTKYSGEDLNNVLAAIDTARKAVNAAETTSNVESAMKTFNDTIAECKTDDQKEAQALADAKKAAKDKIDSYKAEDYSGADKTAVEDAIAKANKAVDDATTIEEVNAALVTAMDEIAACTTDAQKLANAKANANAQLDAVDKTGLSEADAAKVDKEISDAKTAIEKATTVNAVNEALTNANTVIAKIKADAAEEAGELAGAKKLAKAQIESIDSSKYSEPEKTEVEAAKNTALEEIDNATSVDAIKTAITKANNTIASKQTAEQKAAAELQAAKDTALAELNQIDPAAYSGTDRENVEQAIADAKKAIDEATNVEAVNAAVETAKGTVAEQKTDAEKAEEATKQDADKKLQEAKDAAKDAQTAAETAEASKTAAEAAAKTPGQAAVDAAQKALDDANAAKKAADEAQKKAEEAKAIVDEVYKDDEAKKAEAQKLVDDAKTAANNAATAVTNAQSAVNNAKNAKAAADKAKNAIKEVQDLPVVKITKPKAKKKKAIVRWKKVSKKNKKKIQGIQIQVATDAGFKNIVKSTTAKKTKKSKTIKGLKSKTRYWVRIRAYKNVGNVRHVSAWKVKKVKVK